jgi:alpha/beta superfamily hydrolase
MLSLVMLRDERSMPRANESNDRQPIRSTVDGGQADGDGAAQRVEPGTGVREVAEFFGDGHQRIFGNRYRSVAPSPVGVLICPGLQAEFSRNYRREVLLARGLAALGFCVQRFHYRGTGNSDGNSSEATFSTMVEDAVLSAEWMRSKEGCEHLVVLGTRLGGLVAAAAAKRLGSTSLVLWEPFTEPNTYFREIFRAGRIHELEKGANIGPSQESQIQELRRSGELDVLGYSIDRGLYESVKDRRLEEELGELRRPVLLLAVSSRGALKKDLARLVTHLQSLQFQVETHVIAMTEEPWWFVGGRSRDEESSLARELIQVTADWMERTSMSEGAIQ